MALTTIKTGGLADNSVTDAKVADAITVTGAQTGITSVGTLTAPLTVGVDDTGHDVKFFGATAGSSFLWDESADAVLLTDSTPIKIGDSQDMILYHDGSNSYITNSQGGLKIATETSGIAVTIGHTTSETTIADNLSVTGALTIHGATAKTWESAVKPFHIGGVATIGVDVTNGYTQWYENAYLDASDNYKFIENGRASMVYQGAGTHAFRVSTTSNSGGADQSLSWTDALGINSSGDATFAGSITAEHATTPQIMLNDTGATSNRRVFRISGGGDIIHFEGRNNDNSGDGAVPSIASMSMAYGGLCVKGAFRDTVDNNPNQYQLSFGGDDAYNPRWGFRVGTSSESEALYLDRNLSSGSRANAFKIDKSNGNIDFTGRVLASIDSSTSYSTSAELTASNAMYIYNSNGGDGTGDNNFATLRFGVASGAQSVGWLVYQRNGDNSGAFHFQQRTGASSYHKGFTISNTGLIQNTTNFASGTNSYVLQASSSDANEFIVNGDDRYYMFNTWQTSWSDRKLKKNITSITNGLDICDKLNPVTFNWKKEWTEGDAKLSTRKFHGIIAQELQEVVPELVYEGKDKLMVQRDELQWVLLAAIKELSAKVKALENA